MSQSPGHYQASQLRRVSPWFERPIGSTGINAFTRIMSLILTAIAIEFIAAGIKGMFPVLAGA